MNKTLKLLAMALCLGCVTLTNTILFASVTDDRIESTAMKTYVFQTYLKDDDIKVMSKAGNVTLTGTVAEESHKYLARDTVGGLPGVKSVDNKLNLKGDPPAQNTDAWLITKVKFTLLFHRNVDAMGTEVGAQEGVVTLRGKTSSMAQKDLTTAYVMDVDGVKNVRNEMVVTAEVPRKDGAGPEGWQEAGAESVDDASITALVKATLFYHRSTSGLNPSVATNKGVVTLRGKAKNPAERDLAAKLVSDVHGVTKVVNNITVG